MELSLIGSDLFGVTESRVLAALARLAEPVSGRHLAKLAGAQSHSTVLRYLGRLRAIGLVRATETPSATLYRLNRRHVFWAPIEAILTALAVIDQEIVKVVYAELGAAARVAAFGSVATGTSGPESDYDILLVVEAGISSEDRARAVAKVSELIEELTGNGGQVVDVSEDELSKLVADRSPLALEWMKHARPIDDRGRIPQLRPAA